MTTSQEDMLAVLDAGIYPAASNHYSRANTLSLEPRSIIKKKNVKIGENRMENKTVKNNFLIRVLELEKFLKSFQYFIFRPNSQILQEVL